MRRLALAVAAGAGLALGGTVAAQETTATILSFDDLRGWHDDDHAAALSAFTRTCDLINGNDWQALCALARSGPAARVFFELFFRPVLIEDGRPMLFTGYYEPEIAGSPVPTSRFRVPLHRPPPELGAGLWHTRAEIEGQGLLARRGLEIAWIEDPVDAFFLQVQGSGRIRMPDGRVMRLGYAGQNGHPYVSVGQELVRQGIYPQHRVSAATIRAYVQANPEAGADLLRQNPSYVFFREVRGVSPEDGPIGAMARSVTGGRTVAVDPRHVTLGAPVWIEKRGRAPMHRLMVAQDTGGAIRGAQRADIFYGTGDEAGRRAGIVKDPGRMVVLLPIDRAFALATGQPL
jgi:membrane-bound lytic murein transglycosylase A